MGILQKQLSRLSLTVKMVLMSMLVGSVVYVVLDQVVSRTITHIFREQLAARLNQQASAYHYQFNRHVQLYSQAAKLYASRENFTRYLEKIYWREDDPAGVKVQRQVPGWFVPLSIQRALVAPRYAVLFDNWGRAREVYQHGDVPMPASLLQPSRRMFTVSRGESYLVNIDDHPFLLSSQSYLVPGTGRQVTLMLVSPCDQEFMLATQGYLTKGIIVAMINSTDDLVLASSDPERLPTGSSIDRIQINHLSTGQEYYEYGSSEMEFKFASMITTDEIDALTRVFVARVRQFRLASALVYLVCFMLLMYSVARRIEQLTDRVAEFSRKALGGSLPELRHGDQIQNLEDRFQGLTEEVVGAHARIRIEAEARAEESAQLARRERQLELLQAITEVLGVGVLQDDGGRLQVLNRQMGEYAAAFGSPEVFTVGPGRIQELEFTDLQGEERIFQVNRPEIMAGEGIVLVHEITDRRQAERALLESEERFRTLFEDSRDAIYITTRQGKFIAFNQALLELFGYSRDELLELDAEEIYVNADVRSRFKQQIEKYHSVRDFQLLLKKKDATKMDCLLSATVRLDRDGSIIGYQGIIRDVTAQKRLESQFRQAQKMEAIGTLAGGIAHDFNNILTAILGFVDLANLDLDDGVSPRGSLHEIFRAGNRAKDLVRQILDFSRQGEQKHGPVRVHLIVKEALKLLRASIPTTIEIRQDIRDCGLVNGDPTQIHQVMMNLCTNATHAMEKTGGILTVTLLCEAPSRSGSREKAGRYMRLTVVDTGHGFDMGLADRIFDPYFTTKEIGKGSGMGLAVVHGIVESHGGSVSVESEPGKGSSFSVLLSIIEAATPPQLNAPGPVIGGSERIMLVDDEEIITNMLKRVLVHLGYQVTAFNDSREALSAFTADPGAFDLVVTDQTMPNLTGADLSRQLLALRPKVPIILCTGYSETISEEIALGIGIREFLMKPVDMRKIARTVRTVLAG